MPYLLSPACSVSPRLSCHALPYQSCPFCHASPIRPVLFYLASSVVPFLCCHALPVLSCLTCSVMPYLFCHALAVLSCLTCSVLSCIAPTVLLCSGCPVKPSPCSVLSRLAPVLSGHILPVLSCQPWYAHVNCPFPIV